MSEWKEYKLGDIINVKHGYAFKGEYFSETPTLDILLTPGNFNIGGGFKQGKLKYYNGDYPISYILKEGDIIVTMTDLSKEGDTLGYSAKIPKHNKIRYLHNQRIGLLQFIKDDISKDYIYWILRSRDYQKFIINSATGSTVKHTSPSRISEYSFTAPDLPTQIAISEILSSLDDKIELNNKINQELESLAQLLFKRWFVDFEFPNENGEPYKSSGGEMIDSELGEIPKGWRVGYLEDVIEFHNGYAFTSKELESESSTDCYHVFKMGHIKKGGGLNAEGTKSYFSKSKAHKLSKYVLKKGDLLMCMTDMKGNVALLGHTALMNEDDKYIVNQRVGLLRPKNDEGIDYPYLYILTNSFDFIEELRSRANSGVQVNLSTNEIKKSKILIAPKSINEKFGLITKSFYDIIFEITNENLTLRNTRDYLLPKLISGELQINDK